MFKTTNTHIFKSIQNEKELVELAKKQNFNYFLNYYNEKKFKRISFQNALSNLKIDLKNKVILDIGPGTGDTLEVAKELGASRCMAVDMEPFFVKFLILKGYQVFYKNYTVSRYNGRYFPIEVGDLILYGQKVH